MGCVDKQHHVAFYSIVAGFWQDLCDLCLASGRLASMFQELVCIQHAA